MEEAIRHILVPTDFSEGSVQAVEMARDLVGPNPTKVTLAHVFDPQALAPRGNRPQAGAEQMTLEPEIERRIQEALDRWIDERFAGIDAEAVLIIHRSAAEGICEYARKHGIDLIVISTHGRTGLSHLWIGSVAERVVRHAPCPVLTTRIPSAEG